MSVPETAVTEPSIAVPVGTADIAVARRSATRVRAWLLTAMLFLVPLVTYWPATFHDFGLRDDYSNLREAHEEPATVIKFCASHARPIYGWLLQATYGQTDTVQNLQWMRLAASLLLGAFPWSVFAVCGRSAGRSAPACVLRSCSHLIPSAQVMAGWAVGWPYVATALLAVGAFFTVEGALAVGMSAGAGRGCRPVVGGGRSHGRERAHLSAERAVLRGALGGRVDRASAAQPGADGALGRDSPGVRRRQFGSGLLRDERAVCRQGLRQIRPRSPSSITGAARSPGSCRNPCPMP